MKKWFCLSALVIALCLTLTAFAAPGDNMLFFQEDESRSSQSISAMAGTAKGLYTMVSTPDDYNTFQLLYYDYETGETSVIFDKLPQPYWSSESEYAEYGNGLDYKDVINKLFVADDTLYALHTSLGQVSKITVENGKAAREAIGKLDPSILMIEQADYSYSKEIWGLMMAEGKLYVSAYNYEDQEKPANLYRCDLEKGSYEVVTATPIMEMVPYKQGKALCIVYDPNRSWDEVAQKPLPRTIQILDLATGKTEPYYSSEAQFAGLQYDPASDSVFFAQGSQVMRLTADKKVEKVAYLPTSDTYSCLGSALQDGLYAYCSYSGLAIRNTDPAYLPTTVLSIYGGYAGAKETSFVKANPDIALNFPEEYISTVEQMAQTISASKELDIVQTSANYMDFDALIKKGYCADLSGYPELMALVERMYPYLKDYVIRDGKLYAIPVYAYSYGSGYAPEVLKEVDMTPEDLPATFPELCQFINDWNEDLCFEYPDYIPMYYSEIKENLFMDMFHNYCLYYEATGQELTFMTPLFKSLLAAYDTVKTDNLENEDMTDDERWSRRTVLESNYDVVNFSSLDPTDPALNYNISWPIKLSSDTPTYYRTYVTLLFVSPNSQNKDAAAKYLTHVLSNVDSYTKPYLFADMQGNIESPSYQQMLKSWEADVERMKKNLETADEADKKMYQEQLTYYDELFANKERYRYQVTQAALDYFRENVADYCFIAKENPLYGENSEELLPIIRRYQEKAITGDQMIMELDKKIKMIQRESK